MNRLFPILEPPQGGEQLLRQKLSKTPRKRVEYYITGRLVWATTSLAVFALSMVIFWQISHQQDGFNQAGLREDSPLWRNRQVQAWLSTPAEHLLVHGEQEQVLPTQLVYQTEGMRIYQVQLSASTDE